jgi:DNA primase
MKIPEDKIQEIREATDIVEVISQYVTLKKRGKSFLGLCPFHNEKTPSFSVDPVRGFYHCFGCGAGGNAFTFLMEMEKVGFPDVLRSMAKKAGITLPEYQEDEVKVKETELLYHANQYAMEFFQKCLLTHSSGENGLAYLEKRGFTREIIDTFHIGFAPDRWDGLIKSAAKASIQAGSLQKAGLAVPRKEKDGYYDRFRGRLMFPVFTPSGRVVGFGGRTLADDDAKIPKYVNTSETPVYQKGRLLFGLYQSKAGIQKEETVLLVEGYTDVMRLHQNGFNHCAATSGTALTEEQAQVLARYTREVFLLFDGDSAGFEAALRGVDVLMRAGLQVHVASLPRGYDPDSFLKERKPQDMKALLESPRTFIDFSLDRLKAAGKLKTPGDRAKAAHDLLGNVSKIRDSVERNMVIKDIAEKLAVDEDVLLRQIRNSPREYRIPSPVKPVTALSARQAAEEGLLTLLLEDHKWCKPVFKCIQPSQFMTRHAHIVVEKIYKGFLLGQSPDLKTIMNHLSSQSSTIRYLADLLTKKLGEDVDRFQYGLDCILRIQQDDIQQEIQTIREKIRQGEKSGHDVSESRTQWVQLKERMNQIRIETHETWKKTIEI